MMGMREEKLYSTGKSARMLGIHFLTLKKWIYAGKVKAIKTLGGQYRIPESEIRRLLGQPAPKNKAVIYARVSSADQKEDLKRQKQMLQEYAEEHGYEVVATFEDVASWNIAKDGARHVPADCWQMQRAAEELVAPAKLPAEPEKIPCLAGVQFDTEF
jgi:excisionase family DNA binding protein